MAGKPLSRMIPAGGCKGATKKGLRCQSKDVFENGFCKHHGGEGQSLTQRRLVLRMELDKLKAAKFAKRMEKWKKRNPALRRLIEARKARQEEANAGRTDQV